MTGSEALARLKQGNERFAANVVSLETLLSQTRRGDHAAGQSPSAVVLGCSDSRVPAEIVFDQGVGDLFVIRVAGNIVAPSQVGSIEFAVERFGTQLVVVLGHTLCGAITATIEELRRKEGTPSRNLRAIVDRIRPAVAELVAAHAGGVNDDKLMRYAGRANVRASVGHLRHGSEVIEALVEEGTLLVVGAEYDLTTGVVDFFDV